MADPILIGLQEIAEIGGVSRPAVSNWRKRYSDFPEPRVQSDAGALFNLREIETWLLQRNKIDAPIAPGALVWRFAEALRGEWSAATFFEFVTSWLCYLELCQRTLAEENATEVHERSLVVPANCRWDALVDGPADTFERRLRGVANELDELNPHLAELFDFLLPTPPPPTASLTAFVTELQAAMAARSAATLFAEAEERTIEITPGYGEYSTPEILSELLSDLGRAPGVIGRTVFDPACGTGGTLYGNALEASLDFEAPGFSSPPKGTYVGFDVRAAAVRHARARFFLRGWNADIECLNTLRLAAVDLPSADLVVCDPPYGLSNWGDPDVYRSDLWTHGAPPPANADLAWLQVALAALAPEGRAVVLLPASSCSRGGREAAIRESLLTGGTVEAVIQLPPRLKADTSIPLAIWILKPASDTPDPVLLIDASALGTATRSTVELDDDDTLQLTAALKRWRNAREAASKGALEIVAVPIPELISGGSELVARRYAAPSHKADADLLWQQASDAHALAVEKTHALLESLHVEHDEPPLRLKAVSERYRLGDIADLRRIPKGATQPIVANGDEVALRTIAGRAEVTRPASGEPLEGLHVTIIRPAPAYLEPEWLELWLRSSEFHDLMTRYQSGTTIRSLSLKDLANFEIDVPPLEVQEHAARLLGEHDAAIATAEALTEALKQQRAAEIDFIYTWVTP